jgi:hypothetical protein
MTALARYLGSSSLVSFGIYPVHGLSQAACTSLCGGSAESSLHKLALERDVVGEANVDTASECLAMALVESSLEVVSIWNRRVRSAPVRTTPVRNLDFAFRHIGNADRKLRINRKRKPLLSATVSFGLWPRILEKAHTSPELSHGPALILFYKWRETRLGACSVSESTTQRRHTAIETSV